MELEVRRLDSPDEVTELDKGRLEVVTAGGVTVGRATYEPGWRWSEHVGSRVGTTRCAVAHVVLVVTGRMAIEMDDGRRVEVGPGDLCSVPPGHDAWVLGDEPYTSLHLVGADAYAASGS